MRGKHIYAISEPLGFGITPAGAGKTENNCIRTHGFKDHPRRCGENPTMLSSKDIQPGSPPQVRGKRTFNFTDGVNLGITPAGAGKTPPGGMLLLPEQDHPRRCGENRCINSFPAIPKGSPPQVRGKHQTNRPECARAGITPAGAGKTVPVFGHRAHNRDHPRRCGENYDFTEFNIVRVGSPPQVRGKPYGGGLIFLLRRITPAGAGKTLVRATYATFDEDHPRRCGEN